MKGHFLCSPGLSRTGPSAFHNFTCSIFPSGSSYSPSPCFCKGPTWPLASCLQTGPGAGASAGAAEWEAAAAGAAGGAAGAAAGHAAGPLGGGKPPAQHRRPAAQSPGTLRRIVFGPLLWKSSSLPRAVHSSPLCWHLLLPSFNY